MGAHVAASLSRRRPRLWLVVVAAVAVLVIGGLVTWAKRHDTGSGTIKAGTATSSLATRTVEAGAVTVKVEPRQLDADGAVFKVSFDTHSVNLDQDLVRQARLVVGDTTWPAASWSGDGPGGHHREGELRFIAAGTATGPATLSIAGLPAPVTATWDLGR